MLFMLSDGFIRTGFASINRQLQKRRNRCTIYAMDTSTKTDEKGRQYEVVTEGELTIIIGPPEGLVDALGLPEPIATNLHNALFRRKLYNYTAINKSPDSLRGALMETLMLDVQRLSEAFFKYENQEISNV